MTAPDLDRLIERELQIADGETMLGWDGDARDRRKVVAALVQLRDSEALARGKIAEQMIEIERLKANQRCSAIEQGDVGYPCVFRAEAEARIAALEAERADLIKINNGWAGEWDAMREERDITNARADTHLADAYSMRKQRDALAGTISQQIDALQRLVCERDMLNADAERYRFIRSPLAGDSGVVQKELWVEFCYKTCREDKMDALIDGAMRLLRYHIDAAKEKP
jgi:hypothetical protein